MEHLATPAVGDDGSQVDGNCDNSPSSRCGHVIRQTGQLHEPRIQIADSQVFFFVKQ